MRIKSLLAELVILSFLLIACSSAKKDYEKVQQANTIQAYEEFIQKHPQSSFVENATRTLESLKKRFWINTKQSGPSPRDDHEIVYNSFNKKIVLFGGWAGGDKFGDTWEWDGQKWNMISSSGPGSRISHGMTYDSSRKKVVLFGGRNRELLGDTWEWDGSNWKQASNSGPPARCDHAMVYDRTREVTVLFGGLGGILGAIIGGKELTAPETVEFKEQGYRVVL